MPILTERIETRLPIDETFAFIADFANAAAWDPGTATSSRVGAGPVGVGARYELGVRMGGSVKPMTYVITHFDAPNRVVLKGDGSGVDARDDIRFEATPRGGTSITYTADIRMAGIRRLIEPFIGGIVRKLVTDAKVGMERTLEERAARSTHASTAASGS